MIKLFADGAIYSLAMQVREPYIGAGHGEWIMDPDVFARAFKVYWDAGYQIHVHVNGDAGLDMVLDNVETNMRRHPRYDHRTVAIHLAVSQKDQVDRMKRLGVIASANPYYVRALADAYAKEGLGPERADNMVRLGDIERAGVSYSLHSDMPMAPGQPLFLMHCAVNRTTVSGRVAGTGPARDPARRAQGRDAERRPFAADGERHGQHRPRQARQFHHPRRQPADGRRGGHQGHSRLGHRPRRPRSPGRAQLSGMNGTLASSAGRLPAFVAVRNQSAALSPATDLNRIPIG